MLLPVVLGILYRVPQSFQGSPGPHLVVHLAHLFPFRQDEKQNTRFDYFIDRKAVLLQRLAMAADDQQTILKEDIFRSVLNLLKKDSNQFS